MIANYHTHSFRCHHAYGSEWEYAQNAYQAGFQVYGFADHAPWPFPEGFFSKSRMSTEVLPKYIESIHLLKKRYQGKMEVLCGLEAEYYPGLWPSFLEMLRQNAGVEYLILGQHFLNDEYDNPVHTFTPTADENRLALYVDQVSEGMATGKFLYLAHPDVLNFVGEEAVYRRHMRRLCQNAKALGLPLEINFQGVRNKGAYPCNRFFEIAAEEGCQCILGLDAHKAEDAANREEIARFKAFARENGVTLVDRLNIKKENWE